MYYCTQSEALCVYLFNIFLFYSVLLFCLFSFRCAGEQLNFRWWFSFNLSLVLVFVYMLNGVSTCCCFFIKHDLIFLSIFFSLTVRIWLLTAFGLPGKYLNLNKFAWQNVMEKRGEISQKLIIKFAAIFDGSYC